MKQFKRNTHRYIKITIPDTVIYEIHKFAVEIVKRKMTEKQYKEDGDKAVFRWTTGIMGEVAVEMYLKRKFSDWHIGDSKDFNLSDLKKLMINIGIKTSWIGNHPLVYLMNPKRPEIICIRDKNDVYICGIATLPVLRRFTNPEYVKDKKALFKRNPKTGFWGFHALIMFRDTEDIRRLFAYHKGVTECGDWIDKNGKFIRDPIENKGGKNNVRV